MTREELTDALKKVHYKRETALTCDLYLSFNSLRYLTIITLSYFKKYFNLH